MVMESTDYAPTFCVAQTATVERMEEIVRRYCESYPLANMVLGEVVADLRLMLMTEHTAPASQGWRPISSAPKIEDAPLLLLDATDPSKPQYYVGEWLLFEWIDGRADLSITPTHYSHYRPRRDRRGR